MSKGLYAFLLIFILPFLAFVGYCGYQTFNEAMYFSSLQERALYLLSERCNLQECYTDGHMKHVATTTRMNASTLSSTQKSYHYQYTFVMNGRNYYSEFHYGDSYLKPARYFPSTDGIKGQPFVEKIRFSPDNPSISLPNEYAKIISQQPNYYWQDFGILMIVAVLLLGIAIFYFPKREKIEEMQRLY